MLANLLPTSLDTILSLFNLMLETGFVPKEWKIVLVIPILKPSKSSGLTSSYQSI